MVSTLPKQSQAMLFSEPLYTETGVWCELAEGQDPQEWAKQFRRVRRKIYPDPDSIINRFKRLFVFEQSEAEGLPLVCFNTEGITKK